jgi:nucleoid-associated protein YgaU
VPPTAIPSYYARQPDRPNPPLPRLARLPAILDRLCEPRRRLVPVEPEPRQSPAPLRAQGAEGLPRVHRLADGDTLGNLAARYLGDPQRWVELFEANRDVLSDPAILPLGVELKIPAR